MMFDQRHLQPHTLALTFLAGLALMVAACSVTAPSLQMEDKIHSPEDLAVNAQQVRLHIRALVEPYCGAIVESADRISAGTANHAIQREALLWKIEAVPAVREALFRPNPFVAIVDTWVLIWQMTDYFEKGHGKAALGDAARIAATTCKYLEGEFTGFAASLTRSGNVDGVRKITRQWAAEHLIRHSIAGRESTWSDVTERNIQETFSMPEVAVNLAVTLDDLTRRIDIYSAQLLDQSRWQAELFAMDLAKDYQVEKAIPLAESAVQAAGRSIEVVNRIAPRLEGALEAIESAPELVEKERAAAIGAFQVELSRTLQFIEEERIVALTLLTNERKAALLEVNRILVEEHKALIDDMAQVSLKFVDHAFMRLAQLLAVVLVVLILAFFLVILMLKRSSKTDHA